MELDAIIVGQGISGSCLALELLKRGKKIAIFDNDFKDAACLVAAGVLNPITGIRLVKSWRSDIALAYAKNFYQGLENLLGQKFFYNRQILQLCRSLEESELWHKRKSDKDYADFLSQYSPAKTYQSVNDNFGSFKINFAAWVEAPVVMAALKKHFLKLGILRLEKFDYAELKNGENEVLYKSIKAKKVIFCEGWQGIYNPYFNWLPNRPAKGEILSVKIKRNLDEVCDKVIHRHIWLMHYKDDIFRCGSTWDRTDFKTNTPTQSARNELSKLLPTIIKDAEFEIVLQESGVRPCTATTRPHLGRHPKFKNLFLFNGFGSKGYVLSPYFSKHFASFLEGEIELDKEANLSRHERKFFKLT